MKRKKCKNCKNRIKIQGERVNYSPYKIVCNFEYCDELRDKSNPKKSLKVE